MSKQRTIDSFIKDTDFLLAKYKIVQQYFPDATCNMYGNFGSKTVNANYTKFEFQTTYSGLFVVPYCEVELDHNGVKETIKIHSKPRASRLVYQDRWRQPKTLRFSRLSINLKNNQFKDEMLNACRAEMMKYIAGNPGYKLDDKHLEPRLKKLMIFT